MSGVLTARDENVTKHGSGAQRGRHLPAKGFSPGMRIGSESALKGRHRGPWQERTWHIQHASGFQGHASTAILNNMNHRAAFTDTLSPRRLRKESHNHS